MKKIFEVLKQTLKRNGLGYSLFSGKGRIFDSGCVTRFFNGSRSTIPSRLDELMGCLPVNVRVDFYVSIIEDEMLDASFWEAIVERLTPDQKSMLMLALARHQQEKFEGSIFLKASSGDNWSNEVSGGGKSTKIDSSERLAA